MSKMGSQTQPQGRSEASWRTTAPTRPSRTGSSSYSGCCEQRKRSSWAENLVLRGNGLWCHRLRRNSVVCVVYGSSSHLHELVLLQEPQATHSTDTPHNSIDFGRGRFSDNYGIDNTGRHASIVFCVSSKDLRVRFHSHRHEMLSLGVKLSSVESCPSTSTNGKLVQDMRHELWCTSTSGSSNGCWYELMLVQTRQEISMCAFKDGNSLCMPTMTICGWGLKLRSGSSCRSEH